MNFSVRIAGIAAGILLASFATAASTPPALEYGILLDTIHRGWNGDHCWVHPRAGIVPRGANRVPTVVLTMQKLWVGGSDVYFNHNELRTENLGRTWLGPYEHADTLGRRHEDGNVVATICDFWPQWHAKSGKLLGIGHSARYVDEKVDRTKPRQTAYAIYDPAKHTWSRWATLEMPDEPRFFNAGAGSVQRVDLPNGDILLPIYFMRRGDPDYRALVLRCRFDGETLAVLEVGDEVAIKGARGFVEPSLVRFGDRYLLTLRNDDHGYVASSRDGLHFSTPQVWTWDDGTDLGNYNTQQHWVTHRDGLFLIYTRKAGNNDHVFRHRAPLFIGQVDPEKLAVRRSTERILVPDRGARLGNFGVTDIGPDETWVTVAEWMQTWSPQRVIPIDNPMGADNSVFVARICWKTPNEPRP